MEEPMDFGRATLLGTFDVFKHTRVKFWMVGITDFTNRSLVPRTSVVNRARMAFDRIAKAVGSSLTGK